VIACPLVRTLIGLATDAALEARPASRRRLTRRQLRDGNNSQRQDLHDQSFRKHPTSRVQGLRLVHGIWTTPDVLRSQVRVLSQTWPKGAAVRPMGVAGKPLARILRVQPAPFRRLVAPTSRAPLAGRPASCIDRISDSSDSYGATGYRHPLISTVGVPDICSCFPSATPASTRLSGSDPRAQATNFAVSGTPASTAKLPHGMMPSES
jgi:hypothetical protein